MRTPYYNLAEHYIRFAIRYPCWELVENKTNGEMWEAARCVLEELSKEDVDFLEDIFSRKYLNPQAGIRARSSNTYKLQTRLDEIYKRFAVKASLI